MLDTSCSDVQQAFIGARSETCAERRRATSLQLPTPEAETMVTCRLHGVAVASRRPLEMLAAWIVLACRPSELRGNGGQCSARFSPLAMRFARVVDVKSLFVLMRMPLQSRPWLRPRVEETLHAVPGHRSGQHGTAARHVAINLCLMSRRLKSGAVWISALLMFLELSGATSNK